jgi:hypothetical protein
MDDSKPRTLDPGEWHLPYLDGEDTETWLQLRDYDRAHGGKEDPNVLSRACAKVSAARCARVSYLTQEGKRDIVEDMRLYDRLTKRQQEVIAEHSPIHWSPLEHVATPWPQNRQDDFRRGLNFNGLDGINRYVDTTHLPRVGNLLAWRSLRTEEETRLGAVTFA